MQPIYDVAEPILHFRQFMELVQQQASYVSALGQLGISPEDVATNPQYLGNATMGKFTYSGVSYEIVKLLKGMDGEVTGAVIRPVQAQPNGVFITDKQGRKVRSPTGAVGKEGVVNIATLNKMLNQEAGFMTQPGLPPVVPPGVT
jgi:hypothetical protein